MTYERFEDVPVWKTAIELGRAVYRFSAHPAFKGQRSLRDQIERAAVSVSNNIAEGFERGTTPELITFLYYARGSAGEVRSMLCLMEGMDGFTNLKFEISDLKSLAESCSRQLRAWANSLQNSGISGQRHLNDAVRRQADQQKRAREVQKLLAETLPPDHPARVALRPRDGSVD
jgi:four helix bundle protein